MGPQLSETITNWLGSANAKYRKALQPIATLAGMSYDTAVQRRHLGKILQILSEKDPGNQIGELIRNSAASNYAERGELVVTFIRFLLPDNRDAWGAILKKLEDSINPVDKDIKAEFAEYQQQAMKRGPLKSFDDAVDPSGLALTTAVGAGTVYATTQGAAYVGTHGWSLIHGALTSENWNALLHFLHLAASTT